MTNLLRLWQDGNVSRWRCDLILKLICLQVKLLEPISSQVVRSRLRSWTSPWQDDSFSLAILIGRRWIFCYDCVVRVSSAPLLSLFIEVHISSKTWYTRGSFVLQQCCGLFWWLHQSIALLGLILHRIVRMFGGTNSDSTQVFTYRYGYMFGKESARKELAEKVNELKATIQKLENQDKVWDWCCIGSYFTTTSCEPQCVAGHSHLKRWRGHSLKDTKIRWKQEIQVNLGHVEEEFVRLCANVAQLTYSSKLMNWKPWSRKFASYREWERFDWRVGCSLDRFFSCLQQKSKHGEPAM